MQKNNTHMVKKKCKLYLVKSSYLAYNHTLSIYLYVSKKGKKSLDRNPKFGG